MNTTNILGGGGVCEICGEYSSNLYFHTSLHYYNETEKETLKPIPIDAPLTIAGKELIAAAHKYWQIYQEEQEPKAVVWLEAENGEFILFTRGEYKNIIIDNCFKLKNEKPLKETFFEKP